MFALSSSQWLAVVCSAVHKHRCTFTTLNRWLSSLAKYQCFNDVFIPMSLVPRNICPSTLSWWQLGVNVNQLNWLKAFHGEIGMRHMTDNLIFRNIIILWEILWCVILPKLYTTCPPLDTKITLQSYKFDKYWLQHHEIYINSFLSLSPSLYIYTYELLSRVEIGFDHSDIIMVFKIIGGVYILLFVSAVEGKTICINLVP